MARTVTLPETAPRMKEEEGVMEPAGSLERRDTSPGTVPRVEEEEAGTTGVATAGRRVTWPLTVPSRRCVGGVARRDTRWTSALSLPSVATVDRRDT